MINLDHILIFKTNIKSEFDKLSIQNVFDTHDKIQEWSIDSEDKDCVLRIVSESLTYEQIISKIKEHGFECAELK